MRSIREFTGIYLHRDPVDMRKSINGLSQIVESAQMGELFGPTLFVFSGKKRDVIKILYFDRTGFCLWQKRLEKDKFIWPRKEHCPSIVLSSQQLDWLLSGYDVWKMKPHSELKFEKVS